MKSFDHSVLGTEAIVALQGQEEVFIGKIINFTRHMSTNGPIYVLHLLRSINGETMYIVLDHIEYIDNLDNP